MQYRIAMLVDAEGADVEWLESAKKLEQEIKTYKGLDFPPILMKLSEVVAATVTVEDASETKPQQFTEKQLYILEAALRYALDQANDSDIMILDWGDGANQQLSEEAYKQVDMTGVHVVNEQKVISETLFLLGDALASVQHAKDAI